MSCIETGDVTTCPQCILHNKIQAVIEKIRVSETGEELENLSIELEKLRSEI